MTEPSKNNDEMVIATAINSATESIVQLLRIRLAPDLPEEHQKTVDALITTVATRICMEFGPKLQAGQSNAVH